VLLFTIDIVQTSKLLEDRMREICQAEFLENDSSSSPIDETGKLALSIQKDWETLFKTPGYVFV